MHLQQLSNEKHKKNLFHRKKSFEVPIYFSQSLIFISNLFANQKSKFLPCENCIANSGELTNHFELNNQIYAKYILYPYQFTCWYFTSYKMILHNRFYHVAYSCRKVMRKIYVNLFNRFACLSHQITFRSY